MQIIEFQTKTKVNECTFKRIKNAIIRILLSLLKLFA